MRSRALTVSSFSFKTQRVLMTSLLTTSELETPCMLMKSFCDRRSFSFTAYSLCCQSSNSVAETSDHQNFFVHMNFTNHDVITIWIFQHASLLWSFTVTFQRSVFHVQAHACWRIRKVRGLIGAGKSRWTFVTLNVLLSFQT